MENILKILEDFIGYLDTLEVSKMEILQQLGFKCIPEETAEEYFNLMLKKYPHYISVCLTGDKIISKLSDLGLIRRIEIDQKVYLVIHKYFLEDYDENLEDLIFD